MLFNDDYDITDKVKKEHYIKKIAQFEQRVADEYYIKSNGNIVKFSYDLMAMDDEPISIHLEIAEQCFPDIYEADDYVQKTLGWIVIGSSCYHHPICYKYPTQKQIDKLFDMKLLIKLGILKGRYFVLFKDL